MEIKQCKFITSVANAEKCADHGVPEIAIAGKSNVGKSSFINYIVNNTSQSNTKSTNGKTRQIN